MNRRAKELCCALAAAIGVGALGLNASQAVTIGITYDFVNSNPHTDDPLGTQLRDTVRAAADIWQELILDPWALDITIRWADLNANLLGLHQNTGTLVGRPTTALIGFDTTTGGADRDWYFDEFPLTHDEFNLQQTLFISNATGFSGNAPNVLEVGYQGPAAGTAPVAAQNNTDLLTVALHEIGHALGLTANVATSETADGDYDVDPSFVGGSNMAITDDRTFHVVAPLAVMVSGVGPGVRVLPSAADVFAVAAAPNPDNREWTMIELERRHFLGGGDLNDDSSWVGAKAPTASSDAFIQQNGPSPPVTAVTANLDARNLTVQGGSLVDAVGFRIRSIFDTTITGAGTLLRIGVGGELEADNVSVANGAILRVLDDSGGLQTNVNLQGELDITGLSSVEGYGNVWFDEYLENDGLIRATAGNLLWFITASGNYDLDGFANAGTVDATNGDIMISGTKADDFSGTMRVGPGRSISYTFPWVVHQFGEVEMYGLPGANRAAVIAGDEATIFGELDVDGPGELRAEAIFENTAQVTVDDAADHLTLLANATLRGAAFTGAGTLEQLADVAVESNTQIDAATYDWGNSTPNNVIETTVAPNATFTVNSGSTGTPDNQYRGRINLNNGVLEVQTNSPWTLPAEFGAEDGVRGELFLDNNHEYPTAPIVRGNDLILAGLLQATGGRGAVESVLVARPSAEIEVQTSAQLSLEGPVEYDGPLVHGDGTLVQNAHADVVSTTTMATTIYDWDGDLGGPSTMTVQSGAALTIDTSQIDVGAPADDGYGGHATILDNSALIVHTKDPWRLDGTITLLAEDGPTPNAILDGSNLVNFGTIEGNGQLQLSVENHGVIGPGLSPGVLQFQAGFELKDDSLVQIELGGLSPGNQHDLIEINPFGSAELGGILEVRLIDGFVPEDGDEFTILTAGTINGEFAAIAGDNFPIGVDFDVIYDAQAVSLSFRASFTADFDEDGDVDKEDLAQWQTDFGESGNSDADGDGVSSGGDFLAWQRQLGSDAAAQASSQSVPEPGVLSLAYVGVVGVAGRKRRRRANGAGGTS